jgi:hypothetical protein
MRSTMVREHTLTLSNGERIVAAPYEDADIDDVLDGLRAFNADRPAWMPALTITSDVIRPTAWMR